MNDTLTLRLPLSFDILKYRPNNSLWERGSLSSDFVIFLSLSLSLLTTKSAHVPLCSNPFLLIKKFCLPNTVSSVPTHLLATFFQFHNTKYHGPLDLRYVLIISPLNMDFYFPEIGVGSFYLLFLLISMVFGGKVKRFWFRKTLLP